MPRPSIGSSRSTGATSRSDSRPRTQRATFAGWSRTPSRPSARISALAHAIAFSSPGDPLSRWPMRVVRCSSLRHAPWSESAFAITRWLSSR
jgi:hypothetical protein